jgi:hypothetical protein
LPKTLTSWRNTNNDALDHFPNAVRARVPTPPKKKQNSRGDLHALLITSRRADLCAIAGNAGQHLRHTPNSSSCWIILSGACLKGHYRPSLIAGFSGRASSKFFVGFRIASHLRRPSSMEIALHNNDSHVTCVFTLLRFF